MAGFRGGRARGVLAVVALGAVLALAGCGDEPQPVGDPDPGHRLLAALQPVLSVIPAGAHVASSGSTEPVWDSCDGIRSTYGWGSPTVDADFTGGGSDQQVVAHVMAAMQQLGWVFEGGSLSEGSWTWHKRLPSGALASAHFSGGPNDQPPDWSLDASVPPATHPVDGC